VGGKEGGGGKRGKAKEETVRRRRRAEKKTREDRHLAEVTTGRCAKLKKGKGERVGREW
jgi:hypothetical protein